MPNRIVREAILSSEKMALLGWPEEVFYRRLMSIVDDYGRAEANVQLLRARCYPLQTDTVRVADITRWMAACQKSGLILDYEVSGKRYLEITNFQQQQRSPSKWPQPPSIDIKCSPAISDAPVFVSVAVGVSDPSPAKPARARFEDFYAAYPRKAKPVDARKAWDKLKPDQPMLDRMLEAIAEQALTPQWLKEGGQFIPYPATWLNAGQWADEQPKVNGNHSESSKASLEATGIQLADLAAAAMASQTPEAQAARQVAMAEFRSRRAAA